MRIACLALLVAGASCSPPGPSSMDSWYTPGHPKGAELSTGLATPWKTLDTSLVYPVSPDGQGEAEQMLSADPLLQITREHAGKLTGTTLPNTDRKKVCLVRGVHLNRKSGAFVVYYRGDVLLVHHESRGSGRVPMGRQPLIVLLEQIPAKVWVGCEMRP